MGKLDLLLPMERENTKYNPSLTSIFRAEPENACNRDEHFLNGSISQSHPVGSVEAVQRICLTIAR